MEKKRKVVGKKPINILRSVDETVLFASSAGEREHLVDLVEIENKE